MLEQDILDEHMIKDVSLVSESTFAPRIIVKMIDNVEISTTMGRTPMVKDDINKLILFLADEYLSKNKSLSRRKKINKLLTRIKK